MSNPPLLIIGCGDIGRRIGRRALAAGHRVTGLVRSASSAEAARQAGIEPLVAELLDPDSLGDLPSAGSWLIYCAPPPGGGVSDPKMSNLCAAIRPGQEPARMVYLSTSGVYGDCGDREVTEATPVRPGTARARRRLDAETTFTQFGEQRGIPTILLRVTGIYGPFRFPLHRILEGHPLLRRDLAPNTNRIHADDLAQICLAAAERGDPGGIYNVCDGQQSTMTDYFLAVADAFGLPRPPEVCLEQAEQTMNPLMLSYFRESRRMSNRKLIDGLGIRLLYPTLEEGLRASLAEMRRCDPQFFEHLRPAD